MKTVTKIVLATATMAFFMVSAQGQSADADKPVQKVAATTTFTPGKFTDTNKNGTCDNFESRPKTGRGRAFVDKNNDGVCDNLGVYGRGQGRGNGKGPGQGFRNNQGKGNNFGRGNCGGRGYGYGRRTMNATNQ